MQSYEYSIETDFTSLPEGTTPYAKGLKSEIELSTIVTMLDPTGVGVAGDTVTVTFKDVLSPADETSLEGLVSAHTGTRPDHVAVVQLEGHQQNKAAKVAIVGREGSETVKVTMNLADQHTWYLASIRMEGETLVDDGDHQTYSFPSGHIPINMYGGRVHNEAKIRQQVDHKYLITVYVDGVAQTEGYSISFDTNNVIFSESQGDATITADYSRAYKSCWTLYPTEGKVLDIEEAVVFWTDDLVMTGDIIMDVGFHTGAAWVSIEEVMRYSTLYQIIDEAIAVYRVYAGGGPERGFTNNGQKAKLKYTTIRRLKWSDEYGGFKIGLRITLMDHQPFQGERAVATFWATSTPESELET